MRATLILALLALSVQAHAAAPAPGSEDAELMADFTEWVTHQHTLDGLWCCDLSDGRPVSADELRSRDGHYEVLFSHRHWRDGTDQWVAVGDDKIIPGGSPLGMAVAWISSRGYVFCLALGPQG